MLDILSASVVVSEHVGRLHRLHRSAVVGDMGGSLATGLPGYPRYPGGQSQLVSEHDTQQSTRYQCPKIASLGLWRRYGWEHKRRTNAFFIYVDRCPGYGGRDRETDKRTESSQLWCRRWWLCMMMMLSGVMCYYYFRCKYHGDHWGAKMASLFL